MELSQSRPFGTEGRKPTHDFLSLYSPLQLQQDPPHRSSPQGAYLETHDFLQPLDRVGKIFGKDGNKNEVTSIEKPSPPSAEAAEHTLPGGIGTYSISHVSFINQNQRVSKPEGVMFAVAQSSSSDRNDENSNCSSYTGSGFTLWEESAMKKGKTGKENIASDRQVIRETGMRIGGGQWTTSMERPSLSSSYHNHRSTPISSLSSSQPSSALKNRGFVDMIKSTRSAQEEDDDDEEEFVINKETSPNHKANLSMTVDAKGTDQKPNNPRSKHSATEQRRRSKINDRFSMLRELIPHGDQKRDKASVLLEVTEYIQYLQEKVHKYEDSYLGWDHGAKKLTPWGNSQRPTEGFIDKPGGSTPGPPLVHSKFDENTCVSPTIPRNGKNLVESNINSADTNKELDHSRLTNKVSPFPAALPSNIFSIGGSSNAAAPLSPGLDNGESQPQSQLWNSKCCLTNCSDKLKEQELKIDSGAISVSTVYSQGLLNTLTHALQNSGVDLSQASISVQIDLGKRANITTMNSSTSMHKKNDGLTSNQALARSRISSSTEEEYVVQASKRFKTGIS